MAIPNFIHGGGGNVIFEKRPRRQTCAIGRTSMSGLDFGLDVKTDSSSLAAMTASDEKAAGHGFGIGCRLPLVARDIDRAKVVRRRNETPFAIATRAGAATARARSILACLVPNTGILGLFASRFRRTQDALSANRIWTLDAEARSPAIRSASSTCSIGKS